MIIIKCNRFIESTMSRLVVIPEQNPINIALIEFKGIKYVS